MYIYIYIYERARNSLFSRGRGPIFTGKSVNIMITGRDSYAYVCISIYVFPYGLDGEG